ncbi:Patatin-like phospholipase [Seminavis robusta]|uniref:Patatin-like phospholipase n=1 Tax=Seminavis robusta TaxID=568900 RepID=A0A9N8DQH9_9STRA|nr:Patatin-like phospholipase [Seminavis robusta]|eukprot:Sro215_g089000.1 Patatin-like phospholipase (835) ;mRNA; r:35159-37663
MRKGVIVFPLLGVQLLFQLTEVSSFALAFSSTRVLQTPSRNIRLFYENGRSTVDDVNSSTASSSNRYSLGRFQRGEDPEPEEVVVARNLKELRQAVLQDKIPLREIDFLPDKPTLNATTASLEQLGNHPVLQLLRQRHQTNSTPGHRADTAHIALAIEGGGMRGAVSAGMSAAIASLGLTDAFDSVYGSSAGSIVGAYMISRQMCVDVYTQVLPAAKGQFASQRRLMSNVGVGLVRDWIQRLDISSSTNATDDETAEAQNTLFQKLRADKLLSTLKANFKLSPGMNVSFILDGVMSEQHGLRPFDMESFKLNDAKQPLYAVSSTVRDGILETVAFNSKEGDYFDREIQLQNATEAAMSNNDTASVDIPKGRVRRLLRAIKTGIGRLIRSPLVVYRASKTLYRKVKGLPSPAPETQSTEEETTKEAPKKEKKLITAAMSPLFRRIRKKRSLSVQPFQKTSNGTIIQEASACPEESGKKGFFACIESSMLVPGAAGAPVKLLRSKHRQEAIDLGLARTTSVCFDAFCYSPMPYRSAVENGATHVLALRSRPDGCPIETAPAVYERLVAPIYFRRHGLPEVVRFFEEGGSQYRYLEDVLTLDEGLVVGCTEGPQSKGVQVPPTEILFGTGNDEELIVDTTTWKQAHLLPLILPAGTTELPTLTQDKDEVLDAVRNGFAAAFDVLAPIAGLGFDPSAVDSKKIAELMFPRNSDEDDVAVLQTKVNVKGDYIRNNNVAIDSEEERKKRKRFVDWIQRKRRARKKAKRMTRWNPFRAGAVEVERERPDTKQFVKADSLDWLEAEALLAMLPGFQEGKLSYLAEGLRSTDGRDQESFDVPD